MNPRLQGTFWVKKKKENCMTHKTLSKAQTVDIKVRKISKTTVFDKM